MDQLKNITNFDFKSMDQGNKTVVEYIWIAGLTNDLRSKARTIIGNVETIADLPEWNFDGSSTFQATTESSEIVVKPVAIFNDPFRGGKNKMVLCDSYNTDGKPTLSNFRYYAKKIFDKDTDNSLSPCYGLEQEYILMKNHGTGVKWPLGWPIGAYLGPQGMYYCSVGNNNVYGREIADAHYKLCLAAGVEIAGINAEVFPGQWEFQIGVSKGINAADHLWMARYILKRVGEIYSVDISFDPKPIKGDWNGSGCHTNYSTSKTRNEGGIEEINSHMEKLSLTHERVLKMYGEDNRYRLTGKHETSSMEKFTHGIANRACSCRIPRLTVANGSGYYEDRRPASNMDPYVVTSLIFSITHLDSYLLDEIEKQYQDYIENKKPYTH